MALTSKQIIDEFGKDKIQESFNKFLLNILKDNDFLKKYFIRRIPVKYLRKAENKPVVQVFDELPNKEEVVNDILDRILDAACSEMCYKLGVDDSNLILEIIDELDEDEIIEQFISNIYAILKTNQDSILEELRAKRIIDSNLLDLDEVSDINDSIGKTYELNGKLDYDTRDSAFVDVDGTILISNKGDSHAQLIQEYLDKNSINKQLKDDWYRPGEEEINDVFKSNYTAFGHILDSNIFIESNWLENATINQIINDINNAGIDYNKIYDYVPDEITRVARTIK